MRYRERASADFQVVESKKSNGFWVLTNNRSLELMADDSSSAARWMDVLQEMANMVPLSVQAHEHTRPQGVLSPSSSTLSSGRVSTLQSLDAAEPQPPPAPIRMSRGPVGRQVRVLWAYEAQEPDEISISKGEVVELVNSDGQWWIGRVGDSVGSFPSNYVELL